MADIDRDYTDRNRIERERVYAVNSGSTGWWIGGVLILAVLIIGFIALSGGEPAPVDTAPTAVETTTPPAPAAVPAPEPAPMTEAAPAETPAPVAPAEPAPVETAPTEAAPAAPAAPVVPE
ncbi:hypothetical protein [Pelagibacterium lacus]|uniref:Dynamin n=1 Tax=Pelagibacterium lacus TaxID=2282655 RepID=A0A369W3Q5_9HYPH|nr:hypothetical protein [Pelagibacterium lacus]RDE07902.1 hypothetical protein DVH29_14220 [Pelagibacterium lacus]